MLISDSWQACAAHGDGVVMGMINQLGQDSAHADHNKIKEGSGFHLSPVPIAESKLLFAKQFSPYRHLIGFLLLGRLHYEVASAIDQRAINECRYDNTAK